MDTSPQLPDANGLTPASKSKLNTGEISYKDEAVVNAWQGEIRFAEVWASWRADGHCFSSTLAMEMCGGQRSGERGFQGTKSLSLQPTFRQCQIAEHVQATRRAFSYWHDPKTREGHPIKPTVCLEGCRSCLQLR